MSETQSYASTSTAPESPGFDEFAGLSLDDELRQKIEHLVRQEWTPVVEYIESERASEHYWNMWKLPMFGQRDVDRILREISVCRAAHPNHMVRVIGYDNSRRGLGARIVVRHQREQGRCDRP